MMMVSVTALFCPPHALELWTQGSGRSHSQSKHLSVLLLSAPGLQFLYISPPWKSTEMEVSELHHSGCRSHGGTAISIYATLLLGKRFPETKRVKLIYHFILTYHIIIISWIYINSLERFAIIYTGQCIFNRPYFLEAFSKLLYCEKNTKRHRQKTRRCSWICQFSER